MAEPKKRGRPAKWLTEEARAAGKKVAEAKYKATKKNVTLDNECVSMLLTCQGKLKSTLGFTPTLSQTLRYLITNHGKATENG